mgnify:CR=1 FL=1
MSYRTTEEKEVPRFEFGDLYEIRELLTKGYTLEELPLRVTFYTRVSACSDDQLHSLKNQVSFFADYIKQRKNWTYIKGYTDEGITGTSINRRESFKEMIRAGKNKEFDLVIITSGKQEKTASFFYFLEKEQLQSYQRL